VPERNDIQRRLRRAKDWERQLGRWLLEHNGPDPRYRLGGGLVTTTGRVGHITGLRFDVLSVSYTGEAKNEKVPAKWWKYWILICQKAVEEGKHPFLAIKPTNDDGQTIMGQPVPRLHLISEQRHEELLDIERAYLEGREIALPPAPTASAPKLTTLAAQVGRSYSKEAQLGRSPKKGRSK
jgi:hypothetical protein